MKEFVVHVKSVLKVKWLLRRVGFYWHNIIIDCFHYYKVCEECQKFSDIQLVPAATLNSIINA